MQGYGHQQEAMEMLFSRFWTIRASAAALPQR